MKTLNAKDDPVDLSLHKTPITHHNVKMYHHVYTGLRDDVIVPTIESTVAAMVAGGETDLLIIIDARDTKFDRKALAAFKQTSHASQAVVKKIAVVGIHEIQTAFLNYISAVFKLNIKGFNDIDEAKDWLIE